jgi:hypothetical protein
LERSLEFKHVKYIEAIEYLDDGEVAWEIPIKIFHTDESAASVINTTKTLDLEYNSNLSFAILSGFMKSLNKEIFRIDTVYDILVTWKTHTYFSNILFLVFGSLFKYANCIIVKGEVNLKKNSYNETQRLEYLERYNTIRRYTSTIIFLLAFVLTKNVQTAE